MTIRSRSILLGCIALLGAGALLYWCVHTLWWSKIRSEQANVLLNSSYRPAKSKNDTRSNVAEPTPDATAEANTSPSETSQEALEQLLCIEYVAGADAAVWAKIGAKMRGLVLQGETAEEVSFVAEAADVCVSLKKNYRSTEKILIVLHTEIVKDGVTVEGGLWVHGGRLRQSLSSDQSVKQLWTSLSEFKKEFKAMHRLTPPG